MDDLRAHELEDRSHAADEATGVGGGAEHEGEGSCAGADDTARHGCVDKAALRGGVYRIGDFAGGGRVDGGTIDEKAFVGVGIGGKARVEDVAVYGFDMGGFGEGGDDDFLWDGVSKSADWKNGAETYL